MGIDFGGYIAVFVTKYSSCGGWRCSVFIEERGHSMATIVGRMSAVDALHDFLELSTELRVGDGQYAIIALVV